MQLVAAYPGSGESLIVTTASGAFACAGDAAECARDETPAPSPAERLSPDGTRAALIRDSNLWLRDLASGEETQLTADGEEGYAYEHLGGPVPRRG